MKSRTALPTNDFLLSPLARRSKGRKFSLVTSLALLLSLLCYSPQSALADKAADKPRIAIFPLGGDADPGVREKVRRALQAKVDRQGTYEPIDGPRMKELADEAADPISFATAPDVVRKLADEEDAKLIIWGEVNTKDGAHHVHVQVLDLREKDPKPHELEKVISDPTDLRFVTEQILQTLPGIQPFEHPNENSVTHDAESDKLWQSNPDLVVNGDFKDTGHWDGIYQLEKYQVQISDTLPPEDKVAIYRLPADNDQPSHNILALNLSRNCAENNGLACLSDAIPIKPDRRYRISFRYKSDGPTQHVFVKGYTLAKDIKGDPAEREIYRRQVPPSGKTDGQWTTVICDLNPQRPGFIVNELRIDLYAYLSPGMIQFDDVVLKEVGAQTDEAKDDAIKDPTTRP